MKKYFLFLMTILCIQINCQICIIRTEEATRSWSYSVVKIDKNRNVINVCINDTAIDLKEVKSYKNKLYSILTYHNDSIKSDGYKTYYLRLQKFTDEGCNLVFEREAVLPTFGDLLINPVNGRVVFVGYDYVYLVDTTDLRLEKTSIPRYYQCNWYGENEIVSNADNVLIAYSFTTGSTRKLLQLDSSNINAWFVFGNDGRIYYKTDTEKMVNSNVGVPKRGSPDLTDSLYVVTAGKKKLLFTGIDFNFVVVDSTVILKTRRPYHGLIRSENPLKVEFIEGQIGCMNYTKIDQYGNVIKTMNLCSELNETWFLNYTVEAEGIASKKLYFLMSLRGAIPATQTLYSLDVKDFCKPVEIFKFEHNGLPQFTISEE